MSDIANNIKNRIMNRLTKTTLITATILIIALIALFWFFFKEMLIIIVTGLSIVAVTIAWRGGKGQKIYYLCGAILAWILLFIIWDYFDPGTYKLALGKPSFWITQIAAVGILALFGLTGLFVTTMRTIYIVLLVISLFAFGTNFSGESETVNEILKALRHNLIASTISNIKATIERNEETEPDTNTAFALVKAAKEGRINNDDDELKRMEKKYLSQASAKKINSSESQQKMDKPVRRMSGTFTLSAGRGPEETKIWVNPREIVWLAANPKAILFDCKSGQTIGITPDGWTSRPIQKKGYLTFLKESTTSSVDYSIIN